ncbi:MAG: prepilin peptidase [Peptostreptococcaceae bacterium]|nr:prepilin peptidase [Peptostreptococcaceae bacterium]
MLIIVGFIDYDTMYIYDCVLWIFSGITFILMIIYNAMNIIESSAYEHTFNTIFVYVINSMKYNILGLVVGAFIYFSIYYIAKMLYGKEAFGVGDIFLNAAIGFVMGTPYIVISSFFAFFVGLFFIVIFAILGKKFKLKQEVSFGPYMCVSAVIISLYGSKMINFYIDFLYNI